MARNLQVTKESLDGSQAPLAGRSVGHTCQVSADAVSRDGFDLDIAQKAAEVGQVAAVGREGVG